MTKSAAHPITVKQYAVILGVSLSTAYRKMHARKVWGLAVKVRFGNRREWRVLLSPEEVRAMKAAMVDRDRRAGAIVKNSPWGADLTVPRAIRAAARESLIALGCSDLIIALDHARIEGNSRASLARIERLIAA